MAEIKAQIRREWRMKSAVQPTKVIGGEETYNTFLLDDIDWRVNVVLGCQWDAQKRVHDSYRYQR